MITLAPTIPPINYSKSTAAAWRVVKDQVIVEGMETSVTYSMRPILEVPLFMFTEFTTMEEARILLHAMVAGGDLEPSEVSAINVVFPL